MLWQRGQYEVILAYVKKLEPLSAIFRESCASPGGSVFSLIHRGTSPSPSRSLWISPSMDIRLSSGIFLVAGRAGMSV